MTREKFQSVADRYDFVKLGESNIVIGDKSLPLKEFTFEAHRTKGGYVSGFGAKEFDTKETHEIAYDASLLLEKINEYKQLTKH